jgi:hypothetical protein
VLKIRPVERLYVATSCRNFPPFVHKCNVKMLFYHVVYGFLRGVY